MLADAATTLQAAASYHVFGMLDPDVQVDVVIIPGGVVGTVSTHGLTWRQVSRHGSSTVRGDGLWRATLPATQAAALGDSWVQVADPAAGFGVIARIAQADASIPALVFSHHIGLLNRGKRRVNGRDVVELSSSTDVYDVLADGTPFPVRWLDTETRAPDGSLCGISLDRFGEHVAFTVPPATQTLRAPPTAAPSP